jgi:hypothetical protein
LIALLGEVRYNYSCLIFNIEKAHFIDRRCWYAEIKDDFTSRSRVIGNFDTFFLNNKHISKRFAIFTFFPWCSAVSATWTGRTASSVGRA